MSSLLRPMVLESCQTGLRGRRLSSISPLAVIPQRLSDGSSTAEDNADSDSAVFDETDRHGIMTASVESPTEFIVPILSPVSDAHMSDYASKITILHHNTLTTCDASSPTSTSAHTTLMSYKPSFTIPVEEGKLEQVKLERLRWRLASGFFAYFVCGWGDGVTGAVIPYFMAEFHVDFTLSSLLYVASTIGFLIGTLLVELIIKRLGHFSLTDGHWSWFREISFFPKFFSAEKPRKIIGYSPSQARLLVLLVSSCLHGMFFVMMGSKGGYWVSFCAYAVAAFARALLTAALNAYFASGPKHSLGYAFGLWSLGGVASPLVCQAIIATGVAWSRFYLGSLVLSAFNVAFLVITFKPTATEFLRDRENALIFANRQAKDSGASSYMGAISPISKSESQVGSIDDEDKRNSTLRRTLSFPYQWAVSIFVLLYYGCETTIQAFIVTYLLGTRHANQNTLGYVTSGFWGGITIGRFLWGHYAAKLTYTQRKYVIQGCILVGLMMQLLIWFVDSNVQNAFATGIIGLVYGPVFPASLSLANDILPSDICFLSMVFISASASFGSALFPFVTGLISSINGIHTLTFITVPLTGAIACLWFLFPSKIPHRPTII